jgi:hypothetical protein
MSSLSFKTLCEVDAGQGAKRREAHTSTLGGWLFVPGGVPLSYASDDFLLKRPLNEFSPKG